MKSNIHTYIFQGTNILWKYVLILSSFFHMECTGTTLGIENENNW